MDISALINALKKRPHSKLPLLGEVARSADRVYLRLSLRYAFLRSKTAPTRADASFISQGRPSDASFNLLAGLITGTPHPSPHWIVSIENKPAIQCGATFSSRRRLIPHLAVKDRPYTPQCFLNIVGAGYTRPLQNTKRCRYILRPVMAMKLKYFPQPFSNISLSFIAYSSSHSSQSCHASSEV